MSETINNIMSLYPAALFPQVPTEHAHRGSATVGHDGSDVVEFSPRARELAASVAGSSYRVARIQAIREQIQQGTFETPERINGTAERLLDLVG